MSFLKLTSMKTRTLLLVLLLDVAVVAVLLAGPNYSQPCMKHVGDPIEGAIDEGNIMCYIYDPFIICLDPEDPETCVTLWEWEEVGMQENCRPEPGWGIYCQAWECDEESFDPICSTNPFQN
jgi:hypothetical protein